LALANGAAPKAVSQRVGHSDSRTTLDVYSSVTSDMDARLLDVVTAIIPQERRVDTSRTPGSA
jgi:integrase